MPMDDGCPFLVEYGTICEPPRGKNNPHHKTDDDAPYVDTEATHKEKK
jgi:hypothetical protein